MRIVVSSVILCTMIMMMSPGQLAAQVTLRGKVLDESNGEALIGANVFIQDTSIGTEEAISLFALARFGND